MDERLDASVKRILQQNRRMAEELRLHIQETDELQSEMRNVEEGRQKLQREVALRAEVEEQYAKRGAKQAKDLRDAQSKVLPFSSLPFPCLPPAHPLPLGHRLPPPGPKPPSTFSLCPFPASAPRRLRPIPWPVAQKLQLEISRRQTVSSVSLAAVEVLAAVQITSYTVDAPSPVPGPLPAS